MFKIYCYFRSNWKRTKPNLDCDWEENDRLSNWSEILESLIECSRIWLFGRGKFFVVFKKYLHNVQYKLMSRREKWVFTWYVLWDLKCTSLFRRWASWRLCRVKMLSIRRWVSGRKRLKLNKSSYQPLAIILRYWISLMRIAKHHIER